MWGVNRLMWKHSGTRDSGLNKNCRLVLQALEYKKKLTSAQEIHVWLKENIPDKAPGLTTIYRAVDSLSRLNLIQGVDIGDGERRYERVKPGEHHHHLICTTCSHSIHLDQCLVDALAGRVERQHD